jgi:ketosteroid isomerase-like protein
MTVAEVNAVAQAFHDGVANRDAAALASLYSGDARFMPPNLPVFEGPEAIEAAMQGLIDAGARSLEVEPLEVREAGDMTIEYGRYELGREPAGGELLTDRGTYVVVHEPQDDGETKIVLDIFNSDLPADG